MSENSEEIVLSPKELKEKTSKNLLWVGIVSIVMLFGGFTSAWFVMHGGKFWINITLPSAFLVSTIVILISSFTIQYSMVVLKKGNTQLSKILVTLSLLLGITFSVTQWMGWGQLIEKGHRLSGKIMDLKTGEFNSGFGEYGKDFTISFKGEVLTFEDGKLFKGNGKELSQSELGNLRQEGNTSSSMIYLLTGLHLLHLLGGLLYMISVTFKSWSNQFSAESHLKIKLISIYWHFLGGLWIYLYLFLQFIH